MAGNAGIGWVNYVTASTSTLLAGSALASQPVSNLADQLGPTVWRSADQVRSTTLLVDAGSIVSWQAASLHRTNLTSGSTGASIRVRIGNTATGGNYDSGTLRTVVDGQVCVAAPAAITGRYCLIDISEPVQSSIQVGHAFAGPLFVPGVGFDEGSTFGRTSRDSVTTGKSGLEHVTLFSVARTFTATFNGLTDAEVLTVQDMTVDAVKGENVLMVPNILGTPSRECVFGRATIGDIGHAANGSPYRTCRVQVRERR